MSRTSLNQSIEEEDWLTGFWNLIVTSLPRCWPILPTRPVFLPLSSKRPGLIDSFSATKWSDLASQFGLPQKVSQVKLDIFKTPKYHLPLSLHEAMFENAWRWQDVYQEKVDQTREEGSVRILDPVCHQIAATCSLTVNDVVHYSHFSPISRSSHRHARGGNARIEILNWGGSRAQGQYVVQFIQVLQQIFW